MALRVGIDTSPLALTQAGTARHLRSLVTELERDPGLEVRTYGFLRPGRAAVPVRDLGWYLAALPRQARRDGVDVLHCPTFRAPIRAGVPLVVTFHDLAVLRHPETFNAWTRTYSRLVLPRVVRAASLLIAVSEFTRRELVDLLAVPDEKIRVVPNAVSAPFTADGDAAEGDYVLTVSTLEPRKNLARLVEAFGRAGIDGRLIVVGERGWGGVRLDGERVEWAGRVDDDELARLYRGARCVAYPSLYEGFGLPVLEAMACGTPVVASRSAAIAEVADGAAVLVDPHDPDAIAGGLREAVERRDELVPLGLARAAEYDWTRVAAQTAAVYREAAA